MPKKFRINKDKCVGCGVCVQTCNGATRIGEDGKSEILDQEKLEKCGGAAVCPFGAIEEIEEIEEEDPKK